MKKLLIIATFLFVGNATFAQSKDEEAIKKIITTVTISGWEHRNLEEWLNCFAKSEYTIHNMNFKDKGYDVIEEAAKTYLAKNPTPAGSKWEYADWKIKINGTSSFARCVETRTFPTGVKIKIHKVNYLEKIDGDWKVIANIAQTQQADVAEDEAAIKNVIESSTSDLYAANIDSYLNSWANVPYISRIAVNTAGEVSRMNGEEFRAMVGTIRATWKPDPKKITRSNFSIRINGSSAFVVYNQHNENADGSQRDSIEERYLEKMNGEWKIVNVTVIPKK
jgi:hypothetical protein